MADDGANLNGLLDPIWTVMVIRRYTPAQLESATPCNTKHCGMIDRMIFNEITQK